VFVCVSVCTGHDREPCKMAEPIEMPFGRQTCVGLVNHVLDTYVHMGPPGEYD